MIIPTVKYGVNEGRARVTFWKEGVECLSGEKCIDSDYYECELNKWINRGEVVGKCGVIEPPTPPPEPPEPPEPPQPPEPPEPPEPPPTESILDLILNFLKSSWIWFKDWIRGFFS